MIWNKPHARLPCPHCYPQFFICNILQTLTWTYPQHISISQCLNTKSVEQSQQFNFFASDSQNCLLFRKDYFSIRVDLLCFRMHHCNSSFHELRKFREKQREIYFLHIFFSLKIFYFYFSNVRQNRWQKQFSHSTCARIINFLELFWISASRISSNSIWVFQLQSVIRSMP